MILVSASLWDAAAIGAAVLFLWRTPLAIRRHHRHRRCANMRFMRGYRAGYRAASRHDRRVTVEATTASGSSWAPVVRPRPSADACEPLLPASPAATRRKQAG